MKIEELFKKAEKFFVLKPSVQEKKGKKKEKLKNKFTKKINSLKEKIKKKKKKKEKRILIKQLYVLKKFLSKLDDK